MFEKIRLHLFDLSLAYAMRKENNKLFTNMFSRFPKTAELYNARIDEYEERLDSKPGLTEEDSRILWNKLCKRIEKETGDKLQRI